MYILIFIFFSLSVLFPQSAQALGEETWAGEITTVKEQSVEVTLQDGSTVSASHLSPDGTLFFNLIPGDKVMLVTNAAPGADFPYLVSDYDRRQSLLTLSLLFVLVTLTITRLWGLKSIVGMLFSFFLIFKMLLPQIVAGQDPIFVTILTSLFIIPATYYLSHGVNRKTNAAIVGTVLALIITGLIAALFVQLAHLSGLASEEAGFVLAFFGESINVRGLLLAGIILGTLGVLDDVTVSQAAIVTELFRANSRLTRRELFVRAMKIGHDHISSMVNTLVLVYAGASLPLLILFLDSSQSLSVILNHEIVAEEIIRTLVGSIGLILAVPITTAIAVFQTHRK